MLFEKTIQSISDLIDTVMSEPELSGQTVWYRGQLRSDWTLLPSLLRPRGGNPHLLDKEDMLIKRFKQNALQFLERHPQDEWEWMFLMQHHGAPTRLLDWSESPLVGLYFALENSAFDDTDAVLWCLLPVKLNSCVAHIRYDPPSKIPFFGADAELDAYSPTSLKAEGVSVRSPAAAMSYRQSARIRAQLGVFTIYHRELTPIEEIQPAPGQHFIGRLLIPAAVKVRLRNELRALAITKLSMFPELANVAEFAKESVL